MPQENVDALRSMYREWAVGNFRAGGELLDENVVCVVAPGSPEPGVYVGPEGVARWMRLQLDAWERLTIEAEEFIEAGDSVVVHVRRLATGKGAGTPVADRHFHVWTFRGRRVIRYELIPDRARALEAVGLEASESLAPTGNAASVRRFLDRARHDPESVWGIFDESVEWDLRGIKVGPDFAPTSHGPDAVWDFFRRWMGAFEEWDYEVEELVEGPDTVAVRIHQWGRGKTSGVPVDGRFWQVWEMRDGKAVRVVHRAELDGS